MKRVIGLMMFCVGTGMALLFFIPKNFTTILIIGALLITGYQLFCSC